MPEKLLEMTDIVKCYAIGNEEQVVLNHIDFSVMRGEFVSILGPSGSGKSTMMNIIGCLDVPTSGKYVLNGKEIADMDQIELAHIRNKEIGFIFQSFQLLKRNTILENVELPLVYAKVSRKERRERAAAMLDRMGLGNKLDFFPNQLSGGQQQRVAISRAVVTQPSILLADEPTGALDQKTGAQVMELFHELNKEGRTIIMITHDRHIAEHAGRIVKILDGVMSEGVTEDA
ncbi:MAG: ABC transporter ATP-binding protein [Lachnospiraceae bacterium]|nr:ABC transporter ATP-binding protein [Lachnospiraceae bacterium]